jgi:RND superfamily putative drug exporter
VSGSGSALGQDLLNKDSPQQGGYAGQIVFHAKSGTVSADQAAVNQATSNVAKLPDVIKAVGLFASPNSSAVSKDGTIAYSSVSWSVNPNSLETDYLNRLDQAVAPARSAGLQVAYGGGAGQIGQVTHDLKSEIIGLACALVLLVFMFGSLIARRSRCCRRYSASAPGSRCSGCSPRPAPSRPRRLPSPRCSGWAWPSTTDCS